MRELLTAISVLIVALLCLFLSLFALGTWADSVACGSQAVRMQLTHSYGPLQGCMVEVRGQWYPIEAIQYTNGKMEVYNVQ